MSDKMTEQEFIQACKDVDRKPIVEEAFKYLLDNMDDYVDNSDTAYLLYFAGETLEEMPAFKAFHELYGKMPSVERYGDDAEADAAEERCITAFEEVVTDVDSMIKVDEERLQQMFDQLITFYDTKLISDGTNIAPYIENLSGYIEMDKFIYEPFPVELEVKQGVMHVDKDGKPVGSSKPKKVVKKVHIPEGFCIQFELVFWRDKSSTTLPSFSL